MIKKVTLVLLTLCFLGCEFVGWDSSGGNNDDDKPPESSIGSATEFYSEVPISYPLTGSASPIASPSGNTITVPTVNLDGNTSITEISAAETLKVVQAACDQTATSILDISFGTSEATVTWENSNMDMPELTISNESSNDLNLRTVSCIAF